MHDICYVAEEPIVSETERLDRAEVAIEGLKNEVQECKLWEAAHDGVINEKWRNQEATNAMVVAGMERLTSTMTGLARKVNVGIGMFIVAGSVCAFLGGYFGSAS